MKWATAFAAIGAAILALSASVSGTESGSTNEDPAWPDRSTISFLSDLNREAGDRQLHDARFDGRRERALTDGAAVTAYAPSPDGRLFAVARREPRGEIHLLDRNGGFVRRIPAVQGGFVRDLSWSRDGKALVFGFETSTEAWLYIVGTAGRRPARRLTGGFSPEWSPRGDAVLFARRGSDDYFRVVVLRFKGTGPRVVAYEPGPDNP